MTNRTRGRTNGRLRRVLEIVTFEKNASLFQAENSKCRGENLSLLSCPPENCL